MFFMFFAQVCIQKDAYRLPVDRLSFGSGGGGAYFWQEVSIHLQPRWMQPSLDATQMDAPP